MPKDKEMTNHPCHLLSLPSAKRFWCRHCMTVFEDAITRWRHSRSCRYGVVNNFMKRRELEAKALQNTSVLNPVEARLEQSIQMSDLANASATVRVTDENGVEILSSPENFTCFICHKKFQSMEEMRNHVKYPCNASQIVTSSVPHPKHSVPVFIEQLPPRQTWEQQQQPVYIPGHSQQPEQQALEGVEVKMQDPDVESDYAEPQVTFGVASGSGMVVEPQTPQTTVEHSNGQKLTPTTIYVNEKGETVIEVENLDLGSEGGELSLAHLLTQLSQQGIVFDKSRSAALQATEFVMESQGEMSGLQQQQSMYEDNIPESNQSGNQQFPRITAVNSGTVLDGGTLIDQMAPEKVEQDDEEEGQPTAEDAANTLAQLAGFRGFVQHQQQHHQLQASSEAGQSVNPPTEIYQLSVSEEPSVVTPGEKDVATHPDQAANSQIILSNHSTLDVANNQPQLEEPIISSNHITLQEMLTSGNSVTVPAAGHELSGTDESTQYLVDPVTGHQVPHDSNNEAGELRDQNTTLKVHGQNSTEGEKEAHNLSSAHVEIPNTSLENKNNALHTNTLCKKDEDSKEFASAQGGIEYVNSGQENHSNTGTIAVGAILENSNEDTEMFEEEQQGISSSEDQSLVRDSSSSSIIDGAGSSIVVTQHGLVLNPATVPPSPLDGENTNTVYCQDSEIPLQAMNAGDNSTITIHKTEKPVQREESYQVMSYQEMEGEYLADESLQPLSKAAQASIQPQSEIVMETQSMVVVDDSHTEMVIQPQGVVLVDPESEVITEAHPGVALTHPVVDTLESHNGMVVTQGLDINSQVCTVVDVQSLTLAHSQESGLSQQIVEMSEQQPATELQASGQSSEPNIEEQQQQQTPRAPMGTTLFVVTSTGMHPVTRDES